MESGVQKTLAEVRDERRPKFEDVLAIMEMAFEDMGVLAECTTAGPDMWIWDDLVMRAQGIPKQYILSRSLQEDILGYPIITIRQAYSLVLDTWLSLSSVVVGPAFDGISRSLAVILTNHAGAFAGVKYTSAAAASNGGNYHAGVLAVRDLMELSPPTYKMSEELAELLEDAHTPADPQDMN